MRSLALLAAAAVALSACQWDGRPDGNGPDHNFANNYEQTVYEAQTRGDREARMMSVPAEAAVVPDEAQTSVLEAEISDGDAPDGDAPEAAEPATEEAE